MSRLLFLLVLTTGANAAIIGEPLVTCGTDGVAVKIPVDEPFGGHLFIRGQFGKEKCHKDYRKKSNDQINATFAFDICGMRRKRLTNPRGLSISSTLVLSHHPTFITFNDKAYNIECFYKEENHVVHSDFTVSSLKAIEVVQHSAMPTCKYFVLKDGPTGDSVTAINLGDSAYHKWSCETEKHNTYCMRLHTCTADDGEGSIQKIVDANGCSLDETIFPQIEYASDTTAGVLAKAFKFADRSNIFFQCQVGLSLRESYEDGTCPRPNCTIRRRRSATLNEDIFDITAQPITIFELPTVVSAPNNINQNEHSTSAQWISTISPSAILLITVLLCVLFAAMLALLLSRMMR